MIAVTNSSKVFSLYFRNKNDDRCMIDIKDLICTKTGVIGLMKHNMNVNLCYNHGIILFGVI